MTMTNMAKTDKNNGENGENQQPVTEQNPTGQTAATEREKAIKAFKELTAEEDNAPDTHSRMTLASILGGDILGGRWFRRQFWYMVMIVGMLIIYVSNRYSCQQEMIRTKVLNDTLLDRRYKALTRSSQLKERMRRSNIEEALTDTTLQTANTPSFNLKVGR